ncbi:hypothetical protein Fcan01_17894 [Folsomia candida]|uniref:Uncharacterized protein n=1 Tax=Folsomia candida TaxID=158441 RepID=A0A226DPM9_FOLCA|nr:hypothetical protein Fcan01_17894 [Folsomia candida]
MENSLKDLASDDEKITSEQVPEDAPVSANERPKRGKPDLDGKAGSSSKPSTAQKLKKFICKRRKIEKSSQAPLASGVEFSSSGTSSSSASSSDNEGAHGTDLTAVCGMSKIMPKPFFKPRLSARIDDHSIEWYTLGNEIVLDIKLCGYRYLIDHLFPDHLLNGCIVFNKRFGGKSYLQCTTIGEEITITIGGNSLFEFISMNRSDNDGKPDGITNAQKVFLAVFGISPTPKPAGTNQIGWPDRGFELSDQGAFVRKDYFVMCTLKYWYTEIPKILKRKFKIIKKCNYEKQAIIQAKNNVHIPTFDFTGVLMVSKHYMD